jgi:glutathione S-transferase
MKLYNYALAPNPRRVRIFAAAKGIELSLEEVDIPKADVHRSLSPRDRSASA